MNNRLEIPHGLSNPTNLPSPYKPANQFSTKLIGSGSLLQRPAEIEARREKKTATHPPYKVYEGAVKHGASFKVKNYNKSKNVLGGSNSGRSPAGMPRSGKKTQSVDVANGVSPVS